MQNVLVSLRHSRAARVAERGLTLIEIVVVLVILGILFTFLAGRVFGASDKAKADITRLKLKDVKAKVEEYQLRYNELPNSLRSLSTCEQAGAGCVPIVPSNNQGAFQDAWGGDILYSLEGNRAYTIKSLGSDGREGGESYGGDLFEKGP